MNDRERNIVNQMAESLLNGPKSLKAVTDEVNTFFSEQNLGDRVSQDEVRGAGEANSKRFQIDERDHEVWLQSSDAP